VALALALAFSPAAGLVLGEEPALRLRAVAVGPGAAEAPLAIELTRWSTEAERSPLLAALSAPPPAPPAAQAAGARAAGRGGRAGRIGRGGRGGAPQGPLARLTAAVKAAPTLGFIWGDGVTGYSIKYAWRRPSSDGGSERIVLITDRRLGGHAPDSAPAAGAAPDAEFTLIELHLDAKGAGEGKTSLTTNVVVDAAAQTLALDAYASAPVLLKVTP